MSGQDVRTIALTNYAESPAAEAADVVLCSTSRDLPLLGTTMSAVTAKRER